MRDWRKNYEMIYILMVLFSAGMVLWAVCQYKGTKMKDDFFGKETAFAAGWHTEDGQEVDLDKLNHVRGTKANTDFSIYHTIPGSIREGDALCFRSKNIFYKVYIDGELQYDPYVPEHPAYTKSYGTDWNYVQIPAEAAGGEVEVRIRYAYENSRACMDHICIAQPGGALLETFGSKVVAFVTCVLLLFVGLLLIIVDIPVNISFQKNHELRYLGMFSAAIALWCVSETNLVQFFMGDNRVMQVLSCSALMLIPIPIILYLDSTFGFRRKFMVPLICGLSTLQYTICWSLHLLGIADIHETLSLTHVVLAITAAILLFTILRDYVNTHQKYRRNIYHILRTIGLSAISLATAMDIIRYYRGNGTDSAMFVRIGILLFIICFGSSSLERTINAVRLGVQSEFVAQLAYRDGLTQIGNRTSFEEHLADLERDKDGLDTVGIVMFDVNDLKYINDNMGHHYGDQMLVKSADMIRQSFEEVAGDCFRIGGDEFSVLLSGEHIQKRYEEGIAAFRKQLKQYNDQPDKEFRISIAHGFAVYDPEQGDSKMMDIYQRADVEMYHNKKEIKAKQIPPEQYYREAAVGKNAAPLG